VRQKNQSHVVRSRSYTHTNTKTKTIHIHRTPIVCFFIVFLTAFFSAFGIYAWEWVKKPTSFPIRHITVQGQLTHLSPEALQTIVRTQLTGGFFSLDISAVKQAILSFPWIADISFRRVWPDQLVVHVREQLAAARFGKKGVLNSEGAVFYPDVKTLPQNLPDLEGPLDESQALFNFYQTANTLTKLLGLTVVALHINAEQSWDLLLSNQLHVTLGRQEALPRLKRFIAIYPKITALSTRPMISVDLRYPNGVAVRY